MDYSEAELHFQGQQHQMGISQGLLRLYEQLGVVIKSAQYIVLQTPKAPLDVKKCLHQALQILEEIQRQHLQAPPTPALVAALDQYYQILQRSFAQANYTPEDFTSLVPAARQLLLLYRQQQGFKQRRFVGKPPLNVKRSQA